MKWLTVALQTATVAAASVHSRSLEHRPKEWATHVKVMELMAANPDATADLCAKCVNSQEELIVAEHTLATRVTALAAAEGDYATAVGDYTDCIEAVGDYESKVAAAKAAVQTKMTAVQMEITATSSCASAAEGAALAAAESGMTLGSLLDSWKLVAGECSEKMDECQTYLDAKNASNFAVIEARAHIEPAEAATEALEAKSMKECMDMGIFPAPSPPPPPMAPACTAEGGDRYHMHPDSLPCCPDAPKVCKEDRNVTDNYHPNYPGNSNCVLGKTCFYTWKICRKQCSE
jgi:hypothetical protein